MHYHLILKLLRTAIDPVLAQYLQDPHQWPFVYRYCDVDAASQEMRTRAHTHDGLSPFSTQILYGSFDRFEGKRLFVICL